MKRKLILFLLLICLIGKLQAQTVQLKGKVLSADEKIPLPEATVRIQNSSLVQIAGPEGEFLIAAQTDRIE